ncbi:MAG: NAD(P)-binding protein, partial [Alphaproteobacteria bacterium]
MKGQESVLANTDILILGAGMSGLCMGIALRERGVEDFLILEKSHGV